MLGYTEKQAYNLFFKTLTYLKAVYPKSIKYGKDKPTKHIIHLKNGSIIMCYAAGLSGEGIRTYTVTDLVVDEAAPMAREVFVAITPMLSVTKGSLDIISTPRGKHGYFYECSDDAALGDKIKKNFTRFYVNAEDCPRHDKDHLANERESMTALEYAQEYKAMFLDELRQFFPDNLIKDCMTLKRSDSVQPIPDQVGDRFLGVDIARQGQDETVLFSVVRRKREFIKQIDMAITKKTYLTDTIELIKESDKRWDYRKIYIDTGGMGTGVFDPLLKDEQTKRKVVSIDNATRAITNEGKRQKRLMKLDLYLTLLRLMEQGKVKVFNEPEIELSFKSVQRDLETGRIFGKYTHIMESLVRAVHCVNDKSNDMWICSGGKVQFVR